ncbi:MAG: hypothetical protein HY063_14845 [Bacteroidetes bacterium]|nr:hypothetical protein [Bacteroidota bacterium]
MILSFRQLFSQQTSSDFDNLNKLLDHLSRQQKQWVEYSELMTIVPEQGQLLNYMQILEGDKFVEVKHQLGTGVYYWATQTGRKHILNGGYKRSDSFLEWAKSPDNLWKIILFLAGTAWTIIKICK